ncbi:MAG: glycosyltransferase family 4 protein, partial [Cytophagaceae bacterium]
GPFPDPVNGVSVANINLKNYLVSKGLNVSSINTNFRNVSSKQGEGLPLLQLLYFIKYYLQLYKILPSRVVYITPGQSFFGIVKYAPFIFICRLFRKPYLIHIHGNYLGKEYKKLQGLKRKIFRSLISGAHTGIALSPSLKSNFDDLLPDSRIRTVENFAEDLFFTGLGPEKNYGELRVLYMSNLIREKGILDVLDSLLILKKEAVPFQSEIAGHIEKTIEDLVREKLTLLGDQVRYYKEVRTALKKQVLVNANVFILPTYYSMEGQPISIIEAMASGNTIICTPLPGITDIINERNAIFVERENPAGIAGKLKELSKDLPRLRETGQYNATFAMERFRLDVFGGKIYELLKEACRI